MEAQSMIEKVARHIFSANTGTPYYEAHHPAFEYEQEYWETLARAALEAMRTPSKAMIAAGDDVAGTLAITHDYSGELVWERMIDAALNEQEKG